jgi:hypothetical protein
LKIRVYLKDGSRVRIIEGLGEPGSEYVQFLSNQDTKRLPLSQLVTEEEYTEYLLCHPKDRPHMHEVLEAVLKAKKNPRPVYEEDRPDVAHLRAHGYIFVNIPRRFLPLFIEQYEHATGESLRGLESNRPGIYIRERGGWANSLHIHFTGELPAGCPAHAIKDPDGNGWTINDTRYIWGLIAREGFRIGL